MPFEIVAVVEGGLVARVAFLVPWPVANVRASPIYQTKPLLLLPIFIHSTPGIIPCIRQVSETGEGINSDLCTTHHSLH